MNEYAFKSQERIRELIETKCGGSQQKFADLVGINKASVSQYVNGKNAPTNLTATKIGTAFNVSPAWVMGFDVPIDKVSEISAKLGKLTQSQLDIINKMVDAFLS